MASSIKNVTVADSSAVDCGVCQCPLKPPIFQCEVRHMVCSECSEKLAAAETCHVCRRTIAGGYKRCYGAEYIVECLKVPCPNKDYGCSVKLARYDQTAHLQACRHRPYRCLAEDCTFVSGNVNALQDHFVKTHRWPSTAVYDGTTNLALVDGFNVIKPYTGSPPPPPPRTGFQGITLDFQNHLVLLKVTPEPYGRVVTPVHIRPRGDEKCRLKLAYESPCRTHRLEYAFNVRSTSGGMPFIDDRFEFIVPKSVQPLDVDTVKVAFTCWYLDDLDS